MKIHRSIGAVSHGIIDYALAIMLAIGPSVGGFSGKQATWSYLFAAVLFGMAIVTRYPLGIFKHVGLAIHGFVELLLALCLITAPWFGNFSRGVLSRNFYLMIGLLMLVLWALTDFRGLRDRPSAPHGVVGAAVSVQSQSLEEESMDQKVARTMAVMKRYRDAYRLANFTVGISTVIRTIGLLLAAIVAAGGFWFAMKGHDQFSPLPITGFVGSLVAAGAVWLVFWVIGVLIGSQGQILLASLDEAVSHSPFLDDEQRAEVMSLPGTAGFAAA
jgi:hypothetical protein